jgi:hypothetical protein
MMCRAKELALEERKVIIDAWTKEGECTACIAAIAQEEAEREEAEGVGVRFFCSFLLLTFL